MVNEHQSNRSSILTGLGFGLALFGFLSGPTQVWFVDPSSVGLAGKWIVLFGVILVGLGLLTGWKSFREGSSPISPLGAAAALPVIFCLDWLTRSYGFFPPMSFRGEIILLSIISWWLIKDSFGGVLKFLPVIGAIICIVTFFSYGDGKILLYDDHASFFYRLQLIKENFPNIPNYNPLWNAGIEIRDYFATGMLNLFLLFAPLIYLFEIESLYNIIVATVIFVLFPLSVFWGVLLAGHDKRTSSLAAFLSLVASMLWYRWCLKYGAMGFVLAASLFPLNIGFFIKLIDPSREFKKYEAVIFPISLLLMLYWSMSGLALIPLGFVALWKIKTIFKKRYFKTIAGIFLVFYLPWVATFFTISNIGKFVALDQYSAEHELEKEEKLKTLKKDVSDPWSGKMEILVVRGDKRPFTFTEIVSHLREVTIMTNPLILFLALPGFWFLSAASRLSYVLVISWLLGLSMLGTPMKPQLELDRMYLLALGLLVLPTALSIRKIWDEARCGNFVSKALAAIVTGFVLFSLFATTAIINSRREEKYHFTDDSYFELARAIKDHAKGGRTLFPGFILHELSYAHIAPLAALTAQPMVASVHIHSVWWHAELVPDYYLQRGVTGAEEYFDLMNATTLVAHEPSWIQLLEGSPELYKRLWAKGKFRIYERLKSSNSYFLNGSGEVLEQTSSSVRLRVDTDSATVKFNYLPFLEVTGCSNSQVDFPGDLHLIALSECVPGSEVTIQIQPIWRRIWSKR